MKRLKGPAPRLLLGGLCLLVGVALLTVSRPPDAWAIGPLGARVFLPMVTTGPGSAPGPSGTLPPGPSATPTLTPPPTATSTSTPTLTRSPTPTSTRVVLGGTSRLGIWTGSGSTTTASTVQNAGGRWTRLPLSWATIEPTLSNPATYNFRSYDGQLATFSAAGVTSIVEIRDSPSWAARTSCGPIDQPGGLTAFGSFVQAAVQHYMQAPYNIHYWELYNEPDGLTVQAAQEYGVNCFGANATTEAGYVSLLQTAYTAIKTTDPSATVVMGGLAYENTSLFNVNFLDQILQFTPSAAAYFDVANVHYFSSQAPNWSNYGSDIVGKVDALRTVMATHGVTKPVAVTELSWTSFPNPTPTDPSFQASQARYIAKVFARGLNLNLYAIIWFSLSDWNGEDYPYGLLDTNGVPKPSYTAFKAAAAEFGQASSVQPLAPSTVGVNGGVEGYRFDVGGTTRWVLWASPDGTSTQIVLPTGWTQVKDAQGNLLLAAGPQVPATYTLTDSPIFVEF